MIASVRGSLEQTGLDWIEVGLGPISVKVNVPASTVERMGMRGDRVQLHTILQVREEKPVLYGFESEDSRTVFQVLLGIPGIGPRVAMSILSRFDPGSLAQAVASGDTAAFSAVPGIGKKTAGRIILEMAGKLDAALGAAVGPPADIDIVDALTALGFTVAEARQAASSVPSDGSLPLEDRVAAALQQIGGE